jgi:hypothetical protein
VQVRQYLVVFFVLLTSRARIMIARRNVCSALPDDASSYCMMRTNPISLADIALDTEASEKILNINQTFGTIDEAISSYGEAVRQPTPSRRVRGAGTGRRYVPTRKTASSPHALCP